MAKFCMKCGQPVVGAFCGKCGASTQQPASSAPQLSVEHQPPPPQAISTPTPNPAPVKGMSALAKLGIAAVVIIFVGGAMAIGGVFYIAHRVSQKIHEETGSLLSSGSDSRSASSAADSDSANNPLGDVCRFLSKEDVSKAIGIAIVRSESTDNGCSYLAHGNSADMTAKHMAAIAGTKGADARSQKITQQFAGGIFNALQGQQKDPNQDKSGNVPVLIFSIDTNSAETQMRLNTKVLGRLGPGPQELPGIGDQAFDMFGAMIMMRKGDKLVRIMYSTCPCSVEAVKPLAQKLADSL